MMTASIPIHSGQYQIDSYVNDHVEIIQNLDAIFS